MGHVQDPPVSTNMISIVCMIYHMKVHMFGYNLGPQKMSKSKIHILTISEPISMKPAIVINGEKLAKLPFFYFRFNNADATL